MVATYYKKGGPDENRDPVAFMQYLDQCYADTNEQSRSANTLRTLRQHDDQSLASFLPRFEKILAQAGGAAWPDSAKITFLDGALSQRLRSNLVAAVLPDEYHGWVSRVQEIAGRLEGLDKAQRSSGNRGWKSKKSNDNDGDIAMGGMNKVGNKQRGGGGSGGGRQRPGPDNRRCFRCQEPGHFAAACTAPRSAKYG